MIGVDIVIRRKQFDTPGGGIPRVVIADFTLSLRPGEFVCLVGPSGCGKTTLLHAVAGLDREYQGEIRFPGGPRAPRIGYVFQNPRLLPWRTVRQNIQLALAADGTNSEVIDHLLDVMRLRDAQHEFPERLSLGMSRRVALARAFAIQPDLLLMDEPFVSLDAPTARRVRQLLLRVWAEHAHTVLFVTHDLREAIALADRVIFLSASPMRIAREVQVDIPRPSRADQGSLDRFLADLMVLYPEIVDGV